MIKLKKILKLGDSRLYIQNILIDIKDNNIKKIYNLFLRNIRNLQIPHTVFKSLVYKLIENNIPIDIISYSIWLPPNLYLNYLNYVKNINTRLDLYALSPLHRACRADKLLILKILLKRTDIDVNIRSYYF